MLLSAIEGKRDKENTPLKQDDKSELDKQENLDAIRRGLQLTDVCVEFVEFSS